MPRIPASAFEMEQQLKPVLARIFADFAKLQESQATAILKDLPALKADPDRKHLAEAAALAAKELAASAQRWSDLKRTSTRHQSFTQMPLWWPEL